MQSDPSSSTPDPVSRFYPEYDPTCGPLPSSRRSATDIPTAAGSTDISSPLSSVFQCGRFGWLPELAKDVSFPKPPERSFDSENNDSQNRSVQQSSVPSSLTSSLLTQWGVVLSGRDASATGHSSLLLPHSRSPFSLVDELYLGDENVDDSTIQSEDPSAYFRALQNAVTAVLEAEREKQHAEKERRRRAAEEQQLLRQVQEQREREAEVQRQQREAEAEVQRQQREAEAERQQREAEAERQQREAEAERQQREAEAERQRREVEINQRQTLELQCPNSIDSATSRVVDQVVASKLALHQQWVTFLEQEYKMVKEDPQPQMKRFRFSTKKAVTLAVNQLASTSSQVASVAFKLTESLTSLYNRTASDPNHCRLYRYALAITIEALLNNVEVQVVSNPRAVWSFGALLPRVCSSLCCCPDFRVCLESSLLHRCCYIIPYFDFPISSYKKPNESDIVFVQRMAAYLRLWLVFLVVTRETAELWGWYARFLNNAPALFFSPSLLASALEVSGCLALQYFPIQFRKILTSSILQHTLPLYRQLQTKDKTGLVAAAVTQMEVMLDHFKQANTLLIPEGFTLKPMSQSPFGNGEIT